MIKIRNSIKLRTYDGNSLNYQRQRFDNTVAMYCSNLYDRHDKLIFEYDILFDGEVYSLVRYDKNNSISPTGINRWYLQSWVRKNDTPVERELIPHRVEEQEVVGNAAKDGDLLCDVLKSKIELRFKKILTR